MMRTDGGEEVSGPTSYNVLFVCTGNTCRSPMAEALARREIERRDWRHVAVRSAGVSAEPGGAASGAAVRAVGALGLDLAGHRATALDRELIEWADIVLAMSPAHLIVIDEMGGGHKAALLGDFASGHDNGQSVSDPYGADDAAYRATLRQLELLVRQSLDRLSMIVNP